MQKSFDKLCSELLHHIEERDYEERSFISSRSRSRYIDNHYRSSQSEKEHRRNRNQSYKRYSKSNDSDMSDSDTNSSYLCTNRHGYKDNYRSSRRYISANDHHRNCNRYKDRYEDTRDYRRNQERDDRLYRKRIERERQESYDKRDYKSNYHRDRNHSPLSRHNHRYCDSYYRDRSHSRYDNYDKPRKRENNKICRSEWMNCNKLNKYYIDNDDYRHSTKTSCKYYSDNEENFPIVDIKKSLDKDKSNIYTFNDYENINEPTRFFRLIFIYIFK